MGLSIGADGARSLVGLPLGCDGDGRDSTFGTANVLAAHLDDLHRACGDRAGLVKAEHIHAGKRLDAVHLLDKNLLARKTHGRDREDRGGQQHEALWDHSPDGGDGLQERLVDARVAMDHRACEEPYPKGHEDGRPNLDDRVDGETYLRADGFVSLGLLADARRVPVPSHVGHAIGDAAGVHERPAHDLVARILLYGV